MADMKLPMAVLAALALSGTASLAHAQSAARRPQAAFTDPSSTARDAYTLNQAQQSKVIELDGKSRWGLKLEIQQPVTRQVQLKDVEAGAFATRLRRRFASAARWDWPTPRPRTAPPTPPLRSLRACASAPA